MKKTIKEMNQALSRINGIYAKWQEGMNVSGARQNVILALASEPGITQKDIVSKYLVPKQTVSKEIMLMREEGLVELLPDENDRRGKKIVMTEKGMEYTDEILRPYIDLQTKIEKRMKSKVYQQMIEGIAAYANALEQEVSSTIRKE